MKKLLQVEDRFLISGRGLILAPAFPLSLESRARTMTEPMYVVRPDGRRVQMEGRIELVHSRQTDGTSKWSLIVLLPQAEEEDVPVGSEIFCREELCALIDAATAGI